jgi:hypothetical protein
MKDRKAEQPSNAPPSILINEDGSMMNANEEQKLNA